MRKVLKVLGITLGVIVLLVVAAIIIVPLVVDPNDYKPQIAQLVKKATGRDLKLEGDLKLSVFPWLGVSSGAVELGNAPGFEPEPFARFDKAQVQVALLPLLSREVKVSTVVLQGATVNLARNADGKTNWEDLTAASAAPEQKPAEPSSGDMAIGALAVGGIEVLDTTLNWNDALTKTQQRIEGLDLTTGAVSLGPDMSLAPVPIKLSFDARSNQPAVTAHVELSTLAAPNLEAKRHRLDDTQLSVRFDAPDLGVSGNLGLTAQVLADLPKDEVQVNDLRVQLQADNKNPAVSAQADLTTQVTAGITSQKISIKPFEVKVVAKGDAVPGGEAAANLRADISADLKQQTLEVAQLALNALGVALQGKVQGSKIIDAPALNGTLTVPSFNPRDVLAAMKQSLPTMADPQAMTRAEANLDFTATTTSAELSNFVARLDDSTLKTTAGIKNFAKPAITFDVALDAIDVDRYLPPPEEKQPGSEEPTKPAEEKPAADGAATPPAGQEPAHAALRNLDLDGKFTAGKVKVQNLKFSDIVASIDAEKGLVKIHPLGAKGYGGEYRGNVQVDARGEVLKVSVDEKLDSIQAGPLLKDFMGDDKLSGSGTFAIKGNIEGNDPKAMLGSLTGLATLAFRDGAVKGINIGKYVRQASALKEGASPSSVAEEEKTDFASFDATLNLDGGKIRNNDLDVKAPIARIRGEGSVDLLANSVDYLLTAAVAGTSKGQGGREIDQLKSFPIPIRISGALFSPAIEFDRKAFMESVAQGKLKEKEAELKQKVDEEKAKLREETQQKLEEEQDKLKDKLREKLPGLLR